MLYKALVSFSGLVSMGAGQIKELTDKAVIDDLTNAGYIEPVEEKAEPKKETAKKKSSVREG